MKERSFNGIMAVLRCVRGLKVALQNTEKTLLLQRGKPRLRCHALLGGSRLSGTGSVIGSLHRVERLSMVLRRAIRPATAVRRRMISNRTTEYAEACPRLKMRSCARISTEIGLFE